MKKPITTKPSKPEAKAISAEPVKDPDELPNTIDELMAIDPLELSKRSPKAYEKYVLGVIAYHRNQRAAKEAGTATKSKTTTKVTSEQMKSLLAKMSPKKTVTATGGATATGVRRI